MLDLFDVSGFAPHGFCLMWRPWLIWLHAGSDALIAASYFLIPLAILRFLALRPDVGYAGLATLFAAFILLCGATHLVGLATIWWPVYEFEGVLKGATAAASAATAAVAIPLAPKLARVPKPSELEAANAELRDEIARRREALAELEAVRAGLEETVAARTADLEAANARLRVLTAETAHRAKNQLTVVQSIMRLSAASAIDKDALLRTLSGRIDALAVALDAVRQSEAGAVDLETVLRAQLAPWLDGGGDRIVVSGVPVAVGPEAAQQLGLVVHELATNAAKHGALAAQGGAVGLRWTETDRVFSLEWVERGGPGGGRIEREGGFGAMLLDRVAPAQLGGRAERRTTGDGLRYVLTAPAEAIAPPPGGFGAAAEEAALARGFALR